MFGIKILTGKWNWVRAEGGDIEAFDTHQAAVDRAVELGYTTYIVEPINE